MLDKMKGINNEFKQNKGQYNLDRQTGKVSVLSSGHLSKYDFLIGKDILPKEKLQESKDLSMIFLAKNWKRKLV